MSETVCFSGHASSEGGVSEYGSSEDGVSEDGRQLVLFEVDRREVTVAFDGGDVVTDTGLLAVRQLDRRLGVLAEAAARLPDPRSELLRHYSTEQLLTQRVYQLLGGYFDCNDAQTLRRDPLQQMWSICSGGCEATQLLRSNRNFGVIAIDDFN